MRAFFYTLLSTITTTMSNYRIREVAPDSGLGTQVSPHTDADGTAGIKTQINALGGRGGMVLLDALDYSITDTAGIPINYDSINIVAISSSRHYNPNGLYEAVVGTKIRCAGKGFVYGNIAWPQRLGGSDLHDIYLWATPTLQAINSGVVAGSIGIDFIGHVEQLIFENLKTGHFDCAFRLTNAAAAFDTVAIRGGLFLGGRVGVYIGSAISYCGYFLMDRVVIADNLEHCIYLDKPEAIGTIVSNCSFVRGCNATVSSNAANCYVKQNGVKFTGNDVIYAGLVLVTFTENSITYTANNQATADGMIWDANDGIISNNRFAFNGGGYGLRVKGDRNQIIGNRFGSNLSGDIIIESGADDNIIQTYSGVTITDNGARTIINGRSKNVGDPNTTGAWNGVTKTNGLIIADTSDVTKLWLYDSNLTAGRVNLV
jgi:hypothetical protein